MSKYVDSQTQRFDAVVVGAGLVGLSAACVLGQAGYKVCVVDKRLEKPQEAAGMQPSAWVSAINSVSVNVLKHMDVWNALEPSTTTQPYTRMQVDFSEYSNQMVFDSAEMGEKQLGYVVNNAALKHAIWQRLERILDSEAWIQAAPEKWDAEQAGLWLDNGMHIQTSLLLAADGASSWLRTHAEVDYVCDGLEQGAWVGVIQHARMHGDVARQSFTPLGVVGLLPLSDPYRSVVIWSTHRDRGDSVLDFLQQNMLEAYFTEIGSCRCESSPIFLPIRSGQSQTFYKKNMMLIGDAAVSVHPLAGMGLNLGLRGVGALHTLLTKDSPSPALTERFVHQLTRAYHASTYAHASVTRRFILGCLAASESVMGRRLGGFGFSALHAFPWLKNRFAQYAMHG